MNFDHFNENFVIAKCGSASVCHIYFDNCIFNRNYIRLNSSIVWNPIWMENDTYGTIIIKNSIFVGDDDYANSIANWNASFLTTGNTFKCINCSFRSDLVFTQEPSLQPTDIPSLQPTEMPSYQPS